MRFQKMKKPLCIFVAVLCLSFSVPLFSFAEVLSPPYSYFSVSGGTVTVEDNDGVFNVLFSVAEGDTLICTFDNYLPAGQYGILSARINNPVFYDLNGDVISYTTGFLSISLPANAKRMELTRSSASGSDPGTIVFATYPFGVSNEVTAPVHYESIMSDVGDFGLTMFSVWGQVIAFVSAAWPCLIPLLAFIIVFAIRSAKRTYKG